MNNKVYYDGDASKIIGERVILELIQDKKIKIVNNKVLFHRMRNCGNTRAPKPIFTLGDMYADWFYVPAFEGSWIYIDEHGIFRIDYDLDVLEKMVYHEIEEKGDWHGIKDPVMVISSSSVGFRERNGENDNRTLEESIRKSDM
jgi:hypothetical protein